MINTTNFFLNGYEFLVDKDLTVDQILEYFDYKNRLFVLEYNNLICDRNEWSKIKLSSNAKLEIITIVGGG